MMTLEKRIAAAEKNIRQAVEDYVEHTKQRDVVEDISEDFVYRLADDSTRAKESLRELFSRSPVWDDKLDALVINGTRTHDPDYGRVKDLMNAIYEPAYGIGVTGSTLRCTAGFFMSAETDHSDDKAIAAIMRLAPKAYSPGKKKSRIFKALCKELGLADETRGSEFQRLFAQFADELNGKKINFKLYVSLNPAHFLTMSNPKADVRGSTLTSCHSLNSKEHEWNCGCVGYARDEVSFIVFTVSDPKIPETLNNRKTTRQVFAYRPGSGLLLQSRLYNTSGGTHGAQKDSAIYRDLIQRELSELENETNLWKTTSSAGDGSYYVKRGFGFGGYADWTSTEYAGKISLRDGSEDPDPLEVGTHGLCVCCADEISEFMYCGNCNETGGDYCACCENRFAADDMCTAHDRHGNEIRVCSSCLDGFYKCCDECGEYYPDEVVIAAEDGYVCEGCRNEYYERCNECDELRRNEDMYEVFNASGDEVSVCYDCREKHYECCNECGEYVYTNTVVCAYDTNGNRICLCDDCARKHFTECSECGGLFDEDCVEDGRCPDCRDNAKNEMEVSE